MTIRTNLKDGPFSIKHSFNRKLRVKRSTVVWRFDYRRGSLRSYYNIFALDQRFPHPWRQAYKAGSFGSRKTIYVPDYLNLTIDENVSLIYYDKT